MIRAAAASSACSLGSDSSHMLHSAVDSCDAEMEGMMGSPEPPSALIALGTRILSGALKAATPARRGKSCCRSIWCLANRATQPDSSMNDKQTSTGRSTRTCRAASSRLPSSMRRARWAQIRAGRIRAIAVTGSRRMPAPPDLPTLAEQSIPFTTDAWYGVFVPKGTPAAIVDVLHREIYAAIAAPDVRERLLQLNLASMPLKTPAQFGQTVAEDLRVWREIAQRHNIRLGDQ